MTTHNELRADAMGSFTEKYAKLMRSEAELWEMTGINRVEALQLFAWASIDALAVIASAMDEAVGRDKTGALFSELFQDGMVEAFTDKKAQADKV